MDNYMTHTKKNKKTHKVYKFGGSPMKTRSKRSLNTQKHYQIQGSALKKRRESIQDINYSECTVENSFYPFAGRPPTINDYKMTYSTMGLYIKKISKFLNNDVSQEIKTAYDDLFVIIHLLRKFEMIYILNLLNGQTRGIPHLDRNTCQEKQATKLMQNAMEQPNYATHAQWVTGNTAINHTEFIGKINTNGINPWISFETVKSNDKRQGPVSGCHVSPIKCISAISDIASITCKLKNCFDKFNECCTVLPGTSALNTPSVYFKDVSNFGIPNAFLTLDYNLAGIMQMMSMLSMLGPKCLRCICNCLSIHFENIVGTLFFTDSILIGNRIFDDSYKDEERIGWLEGPVGVNTEKSICSINDNTLTMRDFLRHIGINPNVVLSAASTMYDLFNTNKLNQNKHFIELKTKIQKIQKMNVGDELPKIPKKIKSKETYFLRTHARLSLFSITEDESFKKRLIQSNTLGDVLDKFVRIMHSPSAKNMFSENDELNTTTLVDLLKNINEVSDYLKEANVSILNRHSRPLNTAKKMLTLSTAFKADLDKQIQLHHDELKKQHGNLTGIVNTNDENENNRNANNGNKIERKVLRNSIKNGESYFKLITERIKQISGKKHYSIPLIEKRKQELLANGTIKIENTNAVYNLDKIRILLESKIECDDLPLEILQVKIILSNAIKTIKYITGPEEDKYMSYLEYVARCINMLPLCINLKIAMFDILVDTYLFDQAIKIANPTESTEFNQTD
jgi:hypothetical protein